MIPDLLPPDDNVTEGQRSRRKGPTFPGEGTRAGTRPQAWGTPGTGSCRGEEIEGKSTPELGGHKGSAPGIGEGCKGHPKTGGGMNTSSCCGKRTKGKSKGIKGKARESRARGAWEGPGVPGEGVLFWGAQREHPKSLFPTPADLEVLYWRKFKERMAAYRKLQRRGVSGLGAPAPPSHGLGVLGWAQGCSSPQEPLWERELEQLEKEYRTDCEEGAGTETPNSPA